MKTKINYLLKHSSVNLLPPTYKYSLKFFKTDIPFLDVNMQNVSRGYKTNFVSTGIDKAALGTNYNEMDDGGHPSNILLLISSTIVNPIELLRRIEAFSYFVTLLGRAKQLSL